MLLSLQGNINVRCMRIVIDITIIIVVVPIRMHVMRHHLIKRVLLKIIDVYRG